MNGKRRLLWWVYVVSGVVLLTVLAPALVSAPNTGEVLFALVLLTAYGTWSWYLWLQQLFSEGDDDDKK